MPLIKARTERVKEDRFIAKIYVENIERLHAYAAMIGEPVNYVINELISSALESDKEFKDWRKDHPGPHYQTVSKPAKAAKKQRLSTLRTAV